MSFNGAGLFQINTTGQPVVDNTLIDTTVFNALTADLATGLSTCIAKDGQTTPTANIPMAGFKITGIGTGTSNADAAAVQNVNARSMCEGRLTLTTALPVTTSDVTAATTLYFTPKNGSCIGLYDGTNWVRRTFSEISITNATLAASKPYDVFAYDNAGTVTLELLVWTNDTTRATALVTQDGVLVKTGALTRRYLGTIYTDAASKFNDSYALRHVWNYCNRVVRPMRVTEATDSWAYTTATYRQARASTANQLDFVVGVAEDAASAHVMTFGNNTNINVLMLVGIGLDSTTAVATGCLAPNMVSQVASQLFTQQAAYTTIPAAGRHTLVWLEFSTATGTSTWFGDAGTPPGSQSGIHGQVMA